MRKVNAARFDPNNLLVPIGRADGADLLTHEPIDKRIEVHGPRAHCPVEANRALQGVAALRGRQRLQVQHVE